MLSHDIAHIRSFSFVYYFVCLEMIASIPGQLEAEDIEDFCSLAQYYASRTPQSFRKVSILLQMNN